MKQLWSKFATFIKIHINMVVPAVFAVLCVLCGIVSIVASGVTTAYSVEYGGKQIAIVKETEVFEQGKQIALSCISGEKENLVYTPTFKKVLTVEKKINDAKTIGEEIINNTSEIIKGIALTVNGEEKIFAKTKQELEPLLAERLRAYDVSGADENISEFVDKVEFKDIYCAETSFYDETALKNAVNTLNVKTTIQYNEDVVVSYKTVTKYDSSQLFTYRKTTQEGKNGLNHNVDKVVFVNGVETGRTHLEQQVVTAPVNKVVVVGTKYPQDTTASAAGMICPLPRGSYAITSNYGEKRGSSRHYALDLGTYYPKNQPIYAVKAGVVTKAVKSNTGYGYHIIIDHGAGVQTLYAHASALYVSVGDRVTQGQTIARVGSTGNSTGPHLHFEVIVHGVKKNPHNYIKF